MHREYARNFAKTADEDPPAGLGDFEPPHPAARTANPSTAAIAAVHFITIRMRQPFGLVVVGSVVLVHG
jgi:hypothetical protein